MLIRGKQVLKNAPTHKRFSFVSLIYLPVLGFYYFLIVGKSSFNTWVIQLFGLVLGLAVVWGWKRFWQTKSRSWFSLFENTLIVIFVCGLIVSWCEPLFPKETYIDTFKVVDTIRIRGRTTSTEYVVLSNGRARANHVIHKGQTYKRGEFKKFIVSVSYLGTTYIVGCAD